MTLIVLNPNTDFPHELRNFFPGLFYPVRLVKNIKWTIEDARDCLLNFCCLSFLCMSVFKFVGLSVCMLTCQCLSMFVCLHVNFPTCIQFFSHTVIIYIQTSPRTSYLQPNKIRIVCNLFLFMYEQLQKWAFASTRFFPLSSSL